MSASSHEKDEKGKSSSSSSEEEAEEEQKKKSTDLDALLGPAVFDSCAICGSTAAHVVQLSEEEQVAQRGKEQDLKREYEAHTRAYLDAWEEEVKIVENDLVADELDLDDEQREKLQLKMLMWAQQNHPKLCCALRHKNQELMFIA